MAAIPVIIVTGFLGSGKTSLLRHLLPQCRAAGVRPALIVNEVGNSDVDGELLAGLHAEQVKLVGGCICCTLQTQLADTLDDVLARNAGDLIIIECSGLSNPVDVLTALSLPFLLPRVAVSHVVCLLDAPRAEKVLQVAELAKAQLAAADLVVLNKEDRLPPADRAAVAALVADHAPHAAQAWASFGALERALLLQLLTDPAPVRPSPTPPSPHHHHGAHAHALPASFCTAAFALPEALERGAITQLLHALPAHVIRAKGFAHLAGEGWHAMHRVFDTVDIMPIETPPRSGGLLVCIGQHMQPQALAALIAETLGVRV